MDEAKKLADDHWAYIKELLKMYGVTPTAREEFQFKSSAIHFYKHGKAKQ